MEAPLHISRQDAVCISRTAVTSAAPLHAVRSTCSNRPAWRSSPRCQVAPGDLALDAKTIVVPPAHIVEIYCPWLQLVRCTSTMWAGTTVLSLDRAHLARRHYCVYLKVLWGSFHHDGITVEMQAAGCRQQAAGYRLHLQHHCSRNGRITTEPCGSYIKHHYGDVGEVCCSLQRGVVVPSAIAAWGRSGSPQSSEQPCWPQLQSCLTATWLSRHDSRTCTLLARLI